MAWIVVGRFKDGHESVLTGPGKRTIRGSIEHGPRKGQTFVLGEAAWVSKIDAARGIDDGWWKKYAWLLDSKEDADTVLDILNERIQAGQCSEFNKPEKAWVEETA